MPADPRKHYHSKKKQIFLISLFIVIGIFILTGLASLLTDKGIFMTPEQAKMESYLENKYGQEFVVEKPVRKAAGLGVEGYLEANAYSELSQDIKFTVQISHGYINDGYSDAIWQKQITAKIGDKIDNIYDNESQYTIRIISPDDIDVVQDRQVISYDEARRLYGDIPNKISIKLEVKNEDLSLERDYGKIIKQLYDASILLKSELGTKQSIIYDLNDGKRIFIPYDIMANINSKKDITEYIDKEYM